MWEREAKANEYTCQLSNKIIPQKSTTKPPAGHGEGGRDCGSEISACEGLGRISAGPFLGAYRLTPQNQCKRALCWRAACWLHTAQSPPTTYPFFRGRGRGKKQETLQLFWPLCVFPSWALQPHFMLQRAPYECTVIFNWGNWAITDPSLCWLRENHYIRLYEC